MVLVSHKYKFIYIKNRKVAGSSVESFFGRFCLSPDKTYSYADKIFSNIDDYGIIGGRGMNDDTNSLFESHASAIEIRNKIGINKFNKYLKFCVIRNPYDKMVSFFFYKNLPISFKEFVKKFHCNNLNLHSINNHSICDYYIRYENLEQDIIDLCKKIGINDFNINDLPKHKSNKEKRKHYSEYYDEETKKIVYEKHKQEFIKFGYKFETLN